MMDLSGCKWVDARRTEKDNPTWAIKGLKGWFGASVHWIGSSRWRAIVRVTGDHSIVPIVDDFDDIESAMAWAAAQVIAASLP